MSLILIVDDESDVEMLFRQQFRRELRAGLFRMDFALVMITAYGDPDTRRKAMEGRTSGKTHRFRRAAH